MYTKPLGVNGETIAKNFLKKQGYKFLKSNYTTKLGEIDLIFKDKDVVVFVEVKTRNSLKFGRPCEAINLKKQQKIRRIAELFLISHKLYDVACRFDCVEIVGEDSDYSIEHYKNAF